MGNIGIEALKFPLLFAGFILLTWWHTADNYWKIVFSRKKSLYSVLHFRRCIYQVLILPFVVIVNFSIRRTVFLY